MKKKYVALVLAVVLAGSALAGCGTKDGAKDEGAQISGDELPDTGDGEQGEEEGSNDTQDTQDTQDTVYGDIEVWYENVKGALPVEKDGVRYNWYKELTGVGITSPYVEWNGGTTYQEKLNMAISAREMPDLFEPVNGMEADLIKNGALLDLTDLLPEYAPNLWNLISQETWDAVRKYDPSGEGRIYFIPSVVEYTRYAPLIRQDWLDAVEMDMPASQEDFVAVLRAFKEKDPNGNGEADEIPAGGREEARWMDYLFAMYGIAMYEGNPQWDIYDGELTYSAVTTNMRDALEWIAGLYKEGLLDPETMLNDKNAWDGKMYNNQVGIYFHWAESANSFAAKINENSGAVADWTVMPVISAEGYEGYYTAMHMSGPLFCAANTEDEEKIASIMKVLDYMGNMENWDALKWGIEGYDWEYDADGERAATGTAATELEFMPIRPYEKLLTLDYRTGTATESIETYAKQYPDLAEVVTDIGDEMKNLQESGKQIAGDGIPSSIYEGYADIQNRILYVEYATKIIIGEWPIEKFDEFVERWYSSGGKEVTEKAREWYNSNQ